MEQEPSQEPIHISKILPEVERQLRDGVVAPNPSLEQRDERDLHEVMAETEARIAQLEQLADDGQASPEELRELDDSKIDLIGLRQNGGIEQTD